MVFESIFAYFLDKYLSNYIDNFDGSKLKIGIWNGDVVLENLYLKSNALDELNLPIKVVFGHLKKLTLKIPWKSLYYESVKVSIDGLTILAAPKSSISYNAVAEKKESRDNKLKELKRLIELEKEKEKDFIKKSNKDSTDENQDTFSERLQMQILRNIELQISNIHIRYEDDFSKPEHPFAAGITLNSIEIKTADDNWNPTYLKEDKILINKLVSLVSLAIYCNSEEDLLNKQLREMVIHKLQKMTSSENSSACYILNPMSLSTKAILNMKPKQDNFKTPMFDITILLESIGVNLNRLQYFDLMDMLNTIDMMALNAKYQKYQPPVELRKQPKQRWKFAYTAITESQIRPRINQFKWKNIKLVCNSRRNYTQLLRKKLKKGAKLTASEQAAEMQYEEVLDVFNLAFARKQAEMENARIVEKETSKSSWWSWTSSSSVPKADKEKLSEAVDLSKDEKSKLYDAIGYTGEESYSEYPPEYNNWKVKFLLKKFEVALKNGEYKTSDTRCFISHRNLLHLLFENMELNFSKRPVDNGFKLTSSIKSILLTGSSNSSLDSSPISTPSSPNEEPILIQPDRKDQNFMSFNYEQNPLNAPGTKRVQLTSKSLQLTYHAVTVNNIVYFFQSSKLKQKKLKNAALKKISQAKERSILFMKNNLQNVNQIDLNVDIEPSYLIIPENGKFLETAKSICINFGHFSMKSESNFSDPSPSTKEEEDESFVSADEDDDHEENENRKSITSVDTEAEVIKASYKKFQIDLKQMQILLIDNKDSFEKFKCSLRNPISTEDLQSYYILTPLDLFLNIHQCVYVDDVKLPAWRVFGQLPLISTELTSRKLENLIQIITSIPFAKSASIEVQYESIEDLEETSTEIIDTLNIIESDTVALQTKAGQSSYLTRDSIHQAVTLELSFEIKEIYFKLKEEKVKYFDYITFKISSFGTFLQMKTYDIHSNTYLNYIECEYGMMKDIDGSKLYLVSSRVGGKNVSNDRLVDIVITQTDSQSPTLGLLHENVLTKVDIKVSQVDFVLNLVALRNVLRFFEIFQENLVYTKSEMTNNAEKVTKYKTKSIDTHLKEEQITHLITKAKKVYKKSTNILTANLIELQMTAKLDGVKARLCTSHANYFQFNVNNLDVNLTNRLSEKQVEIILNSISLFDLQENAQYKNIVSLKENTENLINVQLTLLNAPRSEGNSKIGDQHLTEKFYFKNYLDEEYFDLIVTANISKLRFMFLFKHLNTLMSLMRIMSDPSSSKPKQSSTEEKTTESQQTTDSHFSFLYRIKLDVTVNAPIILIPYKDQAMLLDCGLIKVQTNLEIIHNYFETNKQIQFDNTLVNERCRIPPLLEVQSISLSNMEISRVILQQDLNIQSELSLVDCSDLKLVVRRNFQPEIYKYIEFLNVKANYCGLLVSMSRGDYTFLIELMQSFGEKEPVSDPDLNFDQNLEEIKPNKNKSGEEKDPKISRKSLDEIRNENILVKFDVQSIQMYLHDQDSVLTEGVVKRANEKAFSKMELNTLKFELNLANNTRTEKDSIKVSFLLDNIILDDTRAVKKKAIRLIERYKCKQVVAKPMIFCSFEKKQVNDGDDFESAAVFVSETRIATTLSCLRMCVNVDYLLLLHDFFIDGLPVRDNVKLKDDEKSGVSKSVSERGLNQATDDRFFCDVRIENPQFVLYENQFELKKTNCLIIDGLIYLNLRTMDMKTKIYLELVDFLIKLKSFTKKTYESRNSYLILSPTSMSLTGLIDNDYQALSTSPTDKKYQSFTCDIQEINMNMCPLMLNTSLTMLNSIQASINQRFSEVDETLAVKEYVTWTPVASLFNPISFRQDDFWFTQLKGDTLSQSSTSSDLSNQSETSSRNSEIIKKQKSELIIRTNKILIKLESGMSDQIPLIALNMSLSGEFTNWAFSPTLSVKLNLEMSYFNEALSSWEPVIEPVEDAHDQLRSYELFLDMITNKDYEVSGHKNLNKKAATSELEKHTNNLKVVRSFQIHSDTSLQFVFTKTFLSLLDTVNKTFTIEDKEASEYDDEKEDIEMEENQIIENLRNKITEDNEPLDNSTLDNIDELDEDDEENFSFNFLIKNELGVDIKLESLFGFMFYNFNTTDRKNLNTIELKNNQSYPILLHTSYMDTLKSNDKSIVNIDDKQSQSQDQLLKFKLHFDSDQLWRPQVVAISNSTTTAFTLESNTRLGSLANSANLMLCETMTILDKRRIRLRSMIQVINTLEFNIKVSYPCTINESSKDESSTSVHWTDDVIKSGKKWCLPLTTLKQNKVDFFRIAPILSETSECQNMQIINWHSAASHKLLSFNENKTFIQVLIEKQPVSVYSNNSSQNIDMSYNIVLLPTVTFNNYLPYTIKYRLDNIDTEQSSLLPGESVRLYRAKIGTSNLLLEIENYLGATWYSSHMVEFNSKKDETKGKQEETDSIDFRASGKLVTLCYNSVLENNCLTFSLYSPYWVINQTKLKLEYKGFDNEIDEIDTQYQDSPLFFKINSKLLQNPNKNLSFRVHSASDWSQNFLIDAVGNTGTVLCKPDKTHKQFYEIGVDIQLSANSLTKIIKLTPYYLLVNSTDLALDVVEVTELNQRNEPNITLSPNTITPFWPTHYNINKNNCIRVIPWLTEDHDSLTSSEISAPFLYNCKHASVLTFKDNIHAEALYVECAPTEEIIRTIIRPYSYGDAPVLVVNCLKNQPISIKQCDEVDDETFLMPEQYFIKTWSNPIGKRVLNWSCGLCANQAYNLDTLQSTQKFQVTLSRDAYCLSFLDGLQKVLMFVDRLSNLNDEVVGFKEITGDEFLLNLNSFSMSLIDDKYKREVLYASVTSSCISWGEKLTNRVKVFKAFPTHQIERIESVYQEYLVDIEQQEVNEYKTYMLDASDEVDFNRMVMYCGKKEISLERHFAPSLYINFFKSVYQTNLHMVIHKLQIDNQLYDSVFPVVFSKVLPPKSVASSKIVKPIIEMSMVQSHSQRTQTSEVKYFKILMQEFSIKLDIIFLNALAAFFLETGNKVNKYVHDSNEFNKELHKVKRSFHDLFHYSLENFSHTRNEKMYFDMCHISPIKIHLSFSMAGADAFKDSNILLDNPFFKSIGLMLTDMQDVVFKLGYFEVKNAAYSWKELSSEATVHYKNQIIKQAYILVLGLDVLGNPFGLIRGLAEGVESLFYEPYAGFVQGPGEFVEGVALGIGKLFGNTLGGAAGAFSKITGTLGKGLATLSFDKDYQKTRQKQAETKSSFLQNVGQNLVMGVVSGVTGIVEKPIEGGKKGGAVGVLGGLGKGLLGVVTKPTAGIVDFTSQSFEGIRKVAVQEESVNRVRPPRRIYRLVTPYRLKEAQCIAILRDLDKGFFANQRFVACLYISKDPRLILIATSRSLLLVKDNFVFGNQTREWSYDYNQLLKQLELKATGQLVVHTNTIEKMFFEKDRHIQRVLNVKDKTTAKKFVDKVNKLIMNNPM